MLRRRPAAGRALRVLLGSAIVLALLLGTAGAAPGFGRPPSESGRSGSPSAEATRIAAVSPPATRPERVAPLVTTLVLQVDGATPTAISLEWSTSSTALFSSFTVAYSSRSASGPFVAAGVITDASTTTFGFEPLIPNATYWWEVREVQSIFGTSTSNVVEATQPVIATLSAQVEAGNPPPIQLAWTDHASYGGLLSFQSFELFEQSAASGGAYQLVGTVLTESARSYTLFDLPAGNYSFYLNTTDCLSCGGSNATSLTTTSNPATDGAPLPLGVSVSSARTILDVNESDVLLCAPSGGEPNFSFAWSIDGAPFAVGNSTFGTSFSASGTYTVACEVTDGTSATASGSIDLSVSPALVAIASLNRTSADVGELIDFSCASTGGTTPISFSWSFGDGTGGSGRTGSHAYSTAGAFAPVCAVFDGAGYSTGSSVNVSVDPALTVTVSATSTSAAPNCTLGFTAVALNGSGVYSNFSWQFGSGAGSGTGVAPRHAYPTPGTYVVTVRVTDSNGIPAWGSTSVDISPLVLSELTAPTRGVAGASLRFVASAAGGAVGPYNYTWAYGDGAIGYGATTTHRYAQAGTYVPTLTVRDRLGAVNTTVGPAVTVVAAPPPLAWLPLWVLVAVGAAAGTAVAWVRFARRRPDGEDVLSLWALPVGPQSALRGLKVCPKCDAENPTIRRTCTVCGSALPKKPHGA